MMFEEVHVVLVEDDPYGRDLMAMLLWRDWRTRVVGETGSLSDLAEGLSGPKAQIIIVDTEHPENPEWVPEATRIIQAFQPKAGILCVATHADWGNFSRFCQPPYCGYVLKHEIAYSLAWAVCLAAVGHWVVTPSVEKMAVEKGLRPVVLSGENPYPGLTIQEAETARQGILFNLPRQNLANEKCKSPDTIYEYISKAYEKLGVKGICEGKVAVEDFFSSQGAFLHYFKPGLDHIWKMASGAKAREKDTLAFHLLTLPEIV